MSFIELCDQLKGQDSRINKFCTLTQEEYAHLIHVSTVSNYVATSFGPGWVRLNWEECNMWAFEELTKFRHKKIMEQKT